MSVLDDPNYIIDLFSYIKARSHSYWAKFVAGQDMFFEFTFKGAKNLHLNNLSGKDMPKLLQYGQEFLASNKEKLKRVIEPIVDRKYGGVLA